MSTPDLPHPALTRRSFLTAAAAAAAATTFGVSPLQASAATRLLGGKGDKGRRSVFPADFWWGVATAAYQIEGAASEDGRTPSVWDTFSKTPKRVKNGDTGDIACDHYHRFKDDVKLIADLGVKHYRFSISWTRIIPEGRGTVNEKGIDFYRRLVDELLAQGITPHATLFHWDSPQTLEDRYGSWRSREMAKDFADYCTATVSRLGDRINHWMTLNEIFCFTRLGYGVGKLPKHAPGTVVASEQVINQTIHHAMLAHGLGCQAIRAASPVPCNVSIVSNYNSYVPAIETPENIAASMKAFVKEKDNALMLMPLLTGAYDGEVLAELGPDAPKVEEGDLKNIAQPIDALGLNVYTGAYVRAAATPRGYEILPTPSDYPYFRLEWLKNVPQSLYWGVRAISEAAGKKDLPVYISENGACADDKLNEQGEVLDLERILYLRSYLSTAVRALEDGYPLTGYFYWSLMDNFEWSEGYSARFGLCYTDYKTEKRTPKLSYHWYREVIRNKAVV
jgi:beta-glucosidase